MTCLHRSRFHRGVRLVPVLLALLGGVAGCAPPAPRDSRASPSVVAPVPLVPASPARGIAHRIDPARTEVRILTFRAGPLARLGHSHVLVSRDLTGTVDLPADASAVAFELELPVATFEIDDPAARAAEGSEFASTPTPADVAGTRRNLLGPQVLDAAAFPVIRVAGTSATGGPADYVVPARVDVRGRTTPLEVPVRVERDGDDLVVRGEFRVAQSTLGLTPFSVALGALQVRDELVVRFRLVAVRAQ